MTNKNTKIVEALDDLLNWKARVFLLMETENNHTLLSFPS